MSLWSEPNQDALSLDPAQVSAGRRIGFLENIERGFETSSLYYSQFGAENALREQENENLQRIRNAGAEAPQTLDPEAADRFGTYDFISYVSSYDPYTDYLRRNNAGGYNTGDRNRDAKLRKLQEQFPDAGIKTYEEIYGSIRERADLARQREARSTDWAGTLGWFVGEIGGAVDPRTNPLNFATLPVGGFGKTFMQRMLTQIGSQSAIEGLDQITGVRENQRLLGGNPSIAESLMQVAATGVGAGVLQGAGEGVGWLGRRWFRNIPGDPSPPPPQAPQPTVREEPLALPYIITPQGPPRQLTYNPRVARGDDIITPPPPKQLTYQPRPFDISAEADAQLSKAVKQVAGTSRLGKQGAMADMLHVRTALNDFAGPNPWEIPPPSYTRVPKDARKLPDAMTASRGETVDQIARRLDPDTFRVYDKYTQQKNEIRAEVEAGKLSRSAALEAEAKPLTDEIASLRERMSKVSKRNQKKYASRVAELEQQQRSMLNGPISSADADVNAARLRLQDVDVRMRDMAPAVSRAYARARQKWTVYDEQASQIDAMIAEGRTELPPVVDFGKAEEILLSPRTLGDRVPELSSPNTKPIAQGTDAVDEIKRVNTETAKMLDAQLDQFQQVYKVYDATLDTKPKGEAKPAPNKTDEAAEPPPDEIEVQGFDTPLHIDEDRVQWVRDDGTVADLSVRELMEELNENQQVLKAITSCSVVKTSVSA